MTNAEKAREIIVQAEADGIEVVTVICQPKSMFDEDSKPNPDAKEIPCHICAEPCMHSPLDVEYLERQLTKPHMLMHLCIDCAVALAQEQNKRGDEPYVLHNPHGGDKMRQMEKMLSKELGLDYRDPAELN